MDVDNLLKIGDIAKLCNITIQTLHYYDKINLLKPYCIDEESNYRYYSKMQVFDLISINYLKYLGFSLKEIREYLDTNDKVKIHEMYNKKRQFYEKQIKTYKAKKDELDVRVALFDSFFSTSAGNNLDENEDIKLVEFRDRHIFFVRERIDFNIIERILLTNKFQALILKERTVLKSPIMHVIHSNYLKLFDEKADIELCKATKFKSKKSANIRVIKAGKFLTSIHRGGHKSSIYKYNKMLAHAEKEKLSVCGPVILKYISTLTEVKDPEKVVFEIQIPVK